MSLIRTRNRARSNPFESLPYTVDLPRYGSRGGLGAGADNHAAGQGRFQEPDLGGEKTPDKTHAARSPGLNGLPGPR